MSACGGGDLGKVQGLIQDGAKVNGKDKDGYAGLHRASMHGHNSIVKSLIVNDANINEKDDREGKTPLMHAASDGQTPVVKTLLLSGADENIEDKDGNNAFSNAAGDDVKAILE